MIITENELKDMDSYCIKILKYQDINGILHMEQRAIDNQVSFYYDITAKQSIQNLYDKATLSYSKVKQLITCMIVTIENAYEYLLKEDDFILLPELVYLNITTGAPYLCYYSGYHKSIKEQMGCFIEYIMNKVDYNDKDAVLLVYSLYAASKEDGYTLNHLTEIMKKQNLSIPANVEYKEDSTNTEKQKEKLIKIEEVTNISKSVNKKDYEPKIQPLSSQIPVMKERLVTEEEVPYYPFKLYLYSGICVIGGIVLIVLGLLSKIIYNTFGNQIDYSKLFAMILLTFCVEGYLLSKIWNKKNRSSKIVSKKEYVNPIKEFYSQENEIKQLENKKINNNILSINALKNNTLSHAKVGIGFLKSSTIQPQTMNNIREKDSKETDKNHPAREDRKSNKLNDEMQCDEPTCLLNGTNNNQELDQKQEANIDQETSIEFENCRPKKLILKPLDELKYESIVITEFPFFIGKLKQNVDYCLEKDIISRYHAKISNEQERFYITDLNSKNGTFLNNETVGTYQLKEIQINDEIAFANIKYLFTEQVG